MLTSEDNLKQLIDKIWEDDGRKLHCPEQTWAGTWRMCKLDKERSQSVVRSKLKTFILWVDSANQLHFSRVDQTSSRDISSSEVAPKKSILDFKAVALNNIGHAHWWKTLSPSPSL